MTFTTAAGTDSPRNRMVASLGGGDDLLHARQKLLRLVERQTQVGDISKGAGPGDLDYDHIAGRTIRPRFNQPQNPTHPRRPSRQNPAGHIASVLSPPVSGHSRRPTETVHHFKGMAPAGRK